MKTIRELCLEPGRAAVFPPERVETMEAALRDDERTSMPWYLRLLVAIGAWLASLFFLGFVLLALAPGWQNHAAVAIVGVALLISAVVVGWQEWGEFAQQAALAVSLAGQALIYVGLLDGFLGDPTGALALLSTVMAGALYFLYPKFLSRLLTCGFAWIVVRLWFFSPLWLHATMGEVPAGVRLVQMTGFWAVLLLVPGLCFLKPRWEKEGAALGYAALVSLVAWQGQQSLVWGMWASWSGSDLPVWCGLINPALMTALAFLGLVVWAAGGLAGLRAHPWPMAGLAVAVLMFAGVGLGDVLLGLLLLATGYLLQNRPILIAGLVMVPFYLALYYYNLQVDLLTKAELLVGSGLLLLTLRVGLGGFLRKVAA